MGLKNIQNILKAAAPYMKVFEGLQSNLDEEVKKLPPEAAKLYNDNTKGIFKAIKSGDFEKAKTLTEASQKKLNKIIANEAEGI